MILFLSFIIYVSVGTEGRMCYTCSNLKLNQTCPKDAVKTNVSDVFSCVLWRTRNDAKEENNSKLLRQTFLYDNECLKTERWKDFMKRRYNVQGEMECCKTDLCNTLEISPVSSASNSTHPDRNYVSGCSKRFRLNGTESLVPSHFIAMNDDLTPPMESVSLELRKKRETTPTGEGSRVKRDINQPGATLTSNQSQVGQDTPSYRLNSVQLILGDEEKIFEFVTSPSTTRSLNSSVQGITIPPSQVSPVNESNQSTAPFSLTTQFPLSSPTLGLAPGFVFAPGETKINFNSSDGLNKFTQLVNASQTVPPSGLGSVASLTVPGTNLTSSKQNLSVISPVLSFGSVPQQTQALNPVSVPAPRPVSNLAPDLVSNLVPVSNLAPGPPLPISPIPAPVQPPYLATDSDPDKLQNPALLLETNQTLGQENILPTTTNRTVKAQTAQNGSLLGEVRELDVQEILSRHEPALIDANKPVLLNSSTPGVYSTTVTYPLNGTQVNGMMILETNNTFSKQNSNSGLPSVPPAFNPSSKLTSDNSTAQLPTTANLTNDNPTTSISNLLATNSSLLKTVNSTGNMLLSNSSVPFPENIDNTVIPLNNNTNQLNNSIGQAKNSTVPLINNSVPVSNGLLPQSNISVPAIFQQPSLNPNNTNITSPVNGFKGKKANISSSTSELTNLTSPMEPTNLEINNSSEIESHNKLLIFYVKFENKTANNNVVLRLLDGNLDPTKLYSVRIEQNGPVANLMVKVSTDEDKGFGSASSSLFFKEDLEPLQLDEYTGFWIRTVNSSVELGRIQSNQGITMNKPIVRWSDSSNLVDVHYVGFTGGGSGGVVLEYACNTTQLGVGGVEQGASSKLSEP